MAQVRKEKRQRVRDLELGIQLADSSKAGFAEMMSVIAMREERHDQATALLSQATRACELLERHPDHVEYARALSTKGKISNQLVYHSLAMSTFQLADDVYSIAFHKGLLRECDLGGCQIVVSEIGILYLNANQLESAKRFFLRALSFPDLGAEGRRYVLHGMARYHNERKEWDKVVECCEKALSLVPGPTVGAGSKVYYDVRLLLMLTDAAEGQRDMNRARAYDKKAKTLWLEQQELFSIYRISWPVTAGKQSNYWRPDDRRRQLGSWRGAQ